MCKYCPHLCNLLRLNCPIFAPMKAQVLILLLLLFLLSITDGQLATVVPLGVWSYVILPVVVSILTILTLTKLSIARATQGIRYDRVCSTHKMYQKTCFHLRNTPTASFFRTDCLPWCADLRLHLSLLQTLAV